MKEINQVHGVTTSLAVYSFIPALKMLKFELFQRLYRYILCIILTIILIIITVCVIYIQIPVSLILENFLCVDGTEIKLNQVCNGLKDCPDGSDENSRLCLRLVCPVNTYQCHYGACIKNTSICDGNANCADNSDESRCGRNHLSCELTEFMCKEGNCIKNDQLCDGETNCLDGSDESSDICTTLSCSENMYTCKHGSCIYLNRVCDGFPDCVDGSDEGNTLCSGFKKYSTCPPIKGIRGVKVQCYSKNVERTEWLSCNSSVPVGTVAQFQCQPFYQRSGGALSSTTRSVCQVGGTWNGQAVKCIPECGRSESIAVPLIVKGWDTNETMWPWHATLYNLEGEKWIFRCGASLISDFAVLTAAHCVWKIASDSLKVVLGKRFNDYGKSDDNGQFLNVSSIVIQPMYQDSAGNYGSDIAILILLEIVQFSRFICPVCLDWELQYVAKHLSPNSIGLIAGMGVTENNTSSDQLRGVDLPVIDNGMCIDSQEKDFRKYVTYTTFCAGWGNGTGVCNGDSGGGLVFPRFKNGKQWILQGIVSVSPRRIGTSFCNPQYFTIFTRVGMYMDWIRGVLNKADTDTANDTLSMAM